MAVGAAVSMLVSSTLPVRVAVRAMLERTSSPPYSCRMSRDVPREACVQVHTLALQKQLALLVTIGEPL